MLEPNPQLRPSVEKLLDSTLMQKTERRRNLILLVQSGIKQGVSMCQVSVGCAKTTKMLALHAPS